MAWSDPCCKLKHNIDHQHEAVDGAFWPLPFEIDGCLFGPKIFQLSPRDSDLARPDILRMSACESCLAQRMSQWHRPLECELMW